jgi:hypothetical protein
MLFCLLLVAGCTSGAVERAEVPQQQSGKALSFDSNNDADFNQAATRAGEWCRETYDVPAKYLSRRAGPTGNIVTFGCTTN